MDPQRQEPVVKSVATAFEAGFERSSAAITKKGLSDYTSLSLDLRAAMTLVGCCFSHISEDITYLDDYRRWENATKTLPFGK